MRLSLTMRADISYHGRQLGELGVGIRLYYEFLKYLARLFAAVALLFFTPIVVLAIIQSYDPNAVQLIGVQQIARAAISTFAETTPVGSSSVTYDFFTVRALLTLPPRSRQDQA